MEELRDEVAVVTGAAIGIGIGKANPGSLIADFDEDTARPVSVEPATLELRSVGRRLDGVHPPERPPSTLATPAATSAERRP